MNTSSEQSKHLKPVIGIGILLLIFIISIVAVGILIYFDLKYVIPAIGAIISFTFTSILLIRQRRITLSNIMTTIISVLCLASSVIEFGYGAFESNLSIHDQMVFSSVLRPKQISHGLANIGAVLVFASLVFARFKQEQKSSEKVQSYKGLFILYLSVCIILLVLGVYLIVDGFPSL